MTPIGGLEVQSQWPVIAFSVIASAKSISVTGTNAKKLVG